MSSAWVWLITAFIAVGVEIFTVDLTFGLIAVGAGTAALAAAVGAPLWLQAALGVGVSVAGIAFIRPYALRHLRGTPQSRTGVDALPGSHARTVAEVSRLDGRIMLKGEVWSARLDPDITSVPVPADTDVVVTRIDGATALVHPIDPPLN
ncbi:MAG: NfeD family protein [Actinomycetales bacterium]|nr:NfeD family protein [Actinomycetales bacterium]